MAAASGAKLADLASRGDEKGVRSLLSARVDSNARDASGVPALHWAARMARPGVFRALIEAKATLHPPPAADQPGSSGASTLLHSLIEENGYAGRGGGGGENGSLQATLQLLLDGRADMDARDPISGASPLVVAARWGRSWAVDALVRHGARIDMRDRRGRTPLAWASRSAHTGCVVRLLRAKANAEAPDASGRTPLAAAAAYGKIFSLQLLLESRVSCDTRDSMGMTPLMCAARSGRVSCVEQLVKARADLSLRDRCGRCAVDHARRYTSGRDRKAAMRRGAGGGGDSGVATTPSPTKSKILRILANAGAVGPARGADTSSRLIDMCRRGDAEGVRALLARGGGKDSVDEAAHVAAQHGRVGVIQALLHGRCSCDRVGDGGLTPLHVASREGHAPVVRELLSQRSPAEARAAAALGTALGSTPLHYAAQNGHVDIIRLLLGARAAVEAKNRYGWRPIHYAAAYASPNALQSLIDHKADIEAPALSRGAGDTPLICATRMGRSGGVAALLRMRADPNARNSVGETALAHAAYSPGAADCLRLLVAARARPDVANRSNQTPLIHATVCSQFNAARDLIAARADPAWADCAGDTPLILAAGSLHHGDQAVARIVVLLVAAGGAELTRAINCAGRTASDCAANTEALQDLVGRGVSEGEAARAAVQASSHEIESILQSTCGLLPQLAIHIVEFWDPFWHYFSDRRFE